MAGILPYNDKERELAVEKAIVTGELPADVSILDIPDFVQSILGSCWRQDAKSRPDMVWCQAVLSAQSTALFESFVHMAIKDIPPQYVSRGTGWNAIWNPSSPKAYALDFLANSSLNAWWVI